MIFIIDKSLLSSARILRHDIQSFVVNNEDYPNASEVSLAISVGKMPQSLLKRAVAEL
jgi:hypothetical protein